MENHNTNKVKSLFNLKFDLKMKITTFLLIVTLFNVQARNYAQNAKISLNLEKVRIEKALIEIETLTDYKFFFSREDIDINKIISIKVENEKVKIILEDIFRNMPVSVEVLGKQIILKEKISTQKTRVPLLKKELGQKIISGQVVDEKGLPIPGANIIAKGTTISTQTDEAGNFTLKLSDDVTKLIVSFIGMETQEVIIGTKPLKIILKAVVQKLEEIVLKGYAKSEQKSINIKRQSLNAIDVLSSNDIGKLPDFNAGDALRRVPGINIIQDQAEARFVSLRGLNANYNATTVDGFLMATPDRDGRRIFMDILPSSLASRIEVTKTVTSNMDGHAIGGAVNFKSRSAYDYAKQLFTVSTSLGNYSNNDGYNCSSLSGTGEVAWANKFGRNEQFGLVLDASYYKRDSYIPQIETGSEWYWFNNDGTKAAPYAGNGIATPRERRWYLYHNNRQRYGFNGKFEFRPSDKLNVGIGSFFYEGTDTEARMENTSTAGGASGSLINQTNSTGTFRSGVNTSVQLGQFEFKRNVVGLNGDLKLATSDKSELKIKSGYSNAKLDNPEKWDNFGRNDLTFNYDTSGKYTTFTPINNTNYQNLSGYKLNYHRLDERQLNEKVYEIQGDWSLNTKPENRGWGFETGLKFRDITRNFNEDRTNWTGNTFYTLDNVAGSEDFSTLLQGGSAGQFLLIDGNKADQTFNNFKSSLTQAQDVNQSNNLDYDAEENIFAFYGQGLYKTDKLALIFGLRYEQTNFNSSGFRKSGTAFIPTSNNSSYSNLLPAVNFSYNTSKDTKLRFAYSKTLGRSPFSTIAARGESINDAVSPIVVSRGNADLKPRLSDNLDLLFDYYLNKGGIISGGLFYKNIKDEIFRFTDTEIIDVNGVSTAALVTQFRNSSDDTSVIGVEMNFIKHFTSLLGFWGGFGVSANATFTNTKFVVTLADGNKIDFDRLAEQPKSIYNAALFYEKYGASARLAYNHTGEMWNSRFSNFTNQANLYRNRFQLARDVVDLQFGYQINTHLSVSANIWNLTSEGVQENIGSNQEIQQMNADFGNAWFIGLAYKL
jgi:TonB-dependent receptor